MVGLNEKGAVAAAVIVIDRNPFTNIPSLFLELFDLAVTAGERDRAT